MRRANGWLWLTWFLNLAWSGFVEETAESVEFRGVVAFLLVALGLRSLDEDGASFRLLY